MKIEIKPTEYGISEEKAVSIQQSFSPVIAEREALAEMYNQLITAEISPELTKKARALRLQLVKTRTSTAKIHKAEKAFFLAAGKFVDAWKNKNIAAIEVMEEKLSEIENYYVILEQNRIKELQLQRAAEIQQYVEVVPENLGEMSEEMWVMTIAGAKAVYDAKIEAERKAEEERLAKLDAERKEQERIKAENERLKKEAEEREKAIALEREKADKIQAELKAKEEAERKAKEAEAERIQAELNKGDAAKVKDLISDLTALKSKYTFNSKKNQKMYSNVVGLIDKVIGYIQK